MEETQEKKLNNIKKSFETYALNNIKDTQKFGMPIAAFILAVCFIDQVSGFIYKNNEKGQRTNTDRCKKFVSEYLNKVSKKPYDKKDLIDLLRNLLVHNYSLTDRRKPKHNRYMLDYENPSRHLYQEEDMVVLNIEGFINDLDNAFQLYKNELDINTELQEAAIEHYNIFGILVHKEIKLAM